MRPIHLRLVLVFLLFAAAGMAGCASCTGNGGTDTDVSDDTADTEVADDTSNTDVTGDTFDTDVAGDTFDTEVDGDTSDTGPTGDRNCGQDLRLGQNAIANGGGEADTGSDGAVVEVTCWTRDQGCFTVMAYEEGYGGFQNDRPPNAGDNLLAGGGSCSDGNQTSVGIQTMSSGTFDRIAGDVASGEVEFELSGQLGGWEDQNDAATIEVRFLDTGGSTLSTASIGPVTSGDRGGQTSFLPRSTTGMVPGNTASIEVVMRAEKTGSSNNDGVADNLSLVLTR